MDYDVPGATMKPHIRAFLYLLMAAALWSLGGVLIKGIPWPALTLAGIRSLVALCFFILYRRGWKIRFTPVMVAGALAYALTLISFVAATKMTTAANAILLQYTAPVYVALFGIWFLKETVNWTDIGTMGIVLGGMGLFFLDKLSTTGFLGNLIAIFSGLCFGWLVLLLRKQKEGTPLDTVILGNLLVVLFCLPFMTRLDARPAHWIGIIILGVLQIAVAYILYTLAIREVRAIEAVLITTLEPILNPIWVFLFLGEKPGQWALLGGSLVVGAILLHQLLSPRKPAESIF
jgi:drug/metabolite transporter (DMT)-like permease